MTISSRDPDTDIPLSSYARARRLGGYAKFQIDDWLMLLGLGLYTATIVSLNVIASGGGSNLYDPAQEGPGSPHPFSEAETEERIYGSKIVIVSEQSMLNTIYVLKVCVLLIYTRLTLGLAAQRFVRYLAVYVGLGWLATEITFFTACRPFSGYWGMPPPNPQCTTYEHYAIVQACFNISSDLMMLFIPLTLVLRLQLPWRRKIVLVFIFGLGIFVIIAALLTKIFNLSDVWSTVYMLWYTREASVAVYVSNLPMIWPVLREWFPFLRSLNPAAHLGSTSLQITTKSHTGPRSGRLGGKRCGSMPSSSEDDRDEKYTSIIYHNHTRDRSLGSLESTIGLDIALREQNQTVASMEASSTEEIVAKPDKVHARGKPNVHSLQSAPHGIAMGGIQVQTSVTVVEEEGSSSARGGANVFDWENAGRNRHQITVGARL